MQINTVHGSLFFFFCMVVSLVRLESEFGIEERLGSAEELGSFTAVSYVLFWCSDLGKKSQASRLNPTPYYVKDDKD